MVKLSPLTNWLSELQQDRKPFCFKVDVTLVKPSNTLGQLLVCLTAMPNLWFAPKDVNLKELANAGNNEAIRNRLKMILIYWTLQPKCLVFSFVIYNKEENTVYLFLLNLFTLLCMGFIKYICVNYYYRIYNINLDYEHKQILQTFRNS